MPPRDPGLSGGYGPGLFSRLITDWLAPAAVALAASREPDFVVGGAGEPYLQRWWAIPRNRWFNIYVHHFLRSDDDRALHDHMYPNLSVLLAGCYVEETVRAGGIHRRTLRQAGEIKLRLPWSAHRIELVDGPCWTLFVTGPRLRNWGFHCAKAGWVPWDRFVAKDDPGAVGPGCEG